jgi:spermidine synthase
VIPWELLDTTTVPGSRTEMSLHRRGHVWSIRVDGVELMNNWIYGPECGLADQGCSALAGREPVRVLIGGLGMGFTLARTLAQLGPQSRVVVAELVPAVVRWNEGLLGELAGHPLRDARVSVVEADVGRVLRAERGGFDAILLDVDNGPEGLSRRSNDRLYGREGLAAARAALRPGGVLAVWSQSGDDGFSERLRRAGYAVAEHRLRQRGGRARQTIFVARPQNAARGG